MRKAFAGATLVALILFLIPTLAISYGDDGHKLVNRTAVAALPADMPDFMKSAAAANEITYEGPEPDRWRSNLERPLNEAQAPDHFVDLEYFDLLKPVPADRYAYIEAAQSYRAAHANDKLPEVSKWGFQPYIVIEVFDRLKVAFREYRHAKAAGEPTAPAEANAIFYAGWLGHYVADGANPMHTTIQYNGWVGANPKGYTTANDIHSKFESKFVRANLDALDIKGMVGAPKHLDHPFDDYLAYLHHSNSLVERSYELEKQCAFDGKGTKEGRDFSRERLGAGAQMLLNMWYTAWVDSAQDPAPYVPAKSNRTKKDTACNTPAEAK